MTMENTDTLPTSFPWIFAGSALLWAGSNVALGQKESRPANGYDKV